MKRKIDIGLDRGYVIIRVPIEMVARILQPRILFASMQEFTPREEEVLAGICDGLRNKEIASKIHVAERTVKFYVTSLLTKVGVKSRRDLQMHFTGFAVNGKGK